MQSLELLLKGLVHFFPIIGWPLAILYLVVSFVVNHIRIIAPLVAVEMVLMIAHVSKHTEEIFWSTLIVLFFVWVIYRKVRGLN